MRREQPLVQRSGEYLSQAQPARHRKGKAVSGSPRPEIHFDVTLLHSRDLRRRNKLSAKLLDQFGVGHFRRQGVV